MYEVRRNKPKESKQKNILRPLYEYKSQKNATILKKNNQIPKMNKKLGRREQKTKNKDKTEISHNQKKRGGGGNGHFIQTQFCVHLLWTKRVHTKRLTKKKKKNALLLLYIDRLYQS